MKTLMGLPTSTAKSPWFVIAILIAAVFAPAASHNVASEDEKEDAGQRVIDKITRDELIALMKSEGYAVDVTDQGNIRWKIDGFRSVIYVADDQHSMQFSVGFVDLEPSLERINEWNRDMRFSSSYLDSEVDPNLKLDLDIAGGVTQDRIVGFLSSCRTAFENWRQHIKK